MKSRLGRGWVDTLVGSTGQWLSRLTPSIHSSCCYSGRQNYVTKGKLVIPSDVNRYQSQGVQEPTDSHMYGSLGMFKESWY